MYKSTKEHLHCFYGYIISKKLAYFILMNCFPISKLIDEQIRTYHNIINAYVISPQSVNDKHIFDSTIRYEPVSVLKDKYGIDHHP